MSEHSESGHGWHFETFLVAINVQYEGDQVDRAHLEKEVRKHIPYGKIADGIKVITNATNESEYEVSWWIAEDDRGDGSDCSSAVFVPEGMTQSEAYKALEVAKNPIQVALYDNTVNPTTINPLPITGPQPIVKVRPSKGDLASGIVIIPIGHIQWYSGSGDPLPQWAKANGQTLRINDYHEAWKVFGRKFTPTHIRQDMFCVPNVTSPPPLDS